MPQVDDNNNGLRTLRLPNDVQEVPQLAAFIEEVCESNGVDMMTTMQMNLALEEAVVNVMNYAYPEGTKGYVDISVQTDSSGLTFVISDSGQPFDPTATPDADISLGVTERPIGGLGIYLVRNIMDSVSYERTDGKNILTMTKNI